MKRSTAITLLALGSGGVALIAANGGKACTQADPVEQQRCRASSGRTGGSSWFFHSSSSPSPATSSSTRGGFGATGAAHGTAAA